MTDQIPTQNPYTIPPPPVPQYSNVVSASPQSANKQKGSGKGAIIAGVSVLALGAIVFGVTKFTGIFSKASSEDNCAPSTITEEQVTANSATIVFQTPSACQVEIAYGTSAQTEALLLQVPEAMASLNHTVKLSPLLPSTAYYYQLKVDGKPLGNVRNFLTLPVSGQTNIVPTSAPTVPSVVPTQAGAKAAYTIEDFQAKFGGSDVAFDIDKNGIVNFGDWVAYQKGVK